MKSGLIRRSKERYNACLTSSPVLDEELEEEEEEDEEEEVCVEAIVCECSQRR